MSWSPDAQGSLLRQLIQPLLDRRRRWRQNRFTRLARQRGERFYCRALAGESDYNLSINCDMTVSCNCQDSDRRSVIGDLSTTNLDSILHGERAQELRHELAAGRLPIDTCLGCSELATIVAKDAEQRSFQLSVPRRGIMVENTVLCNLRCSSCVRSVLTRSRLKKQLSLEDIRIISTEIRQHRIETLSYFKFGEPFMSPTILEELSLIRHDNPDLHLIISTNGMVLQTERQRQAALLANHLYFSIDGIDDRMVQRYQQRGSFQRSYQNMKDLVAFRHRQGSRRPIIEWKYVVFRWNDQKATIETAVDLARKAGVDAISFWPASHPLTGRSWRYRLSGSVRRVGTESWKGRELRF